MIFSMRRTFFLHAPAAPLLTITLILASPSWLRYGLGSCCDSTCGQIPIPFPFYLNENKRCGLAGFGLTCIDGTPPSLSLNISQTSYRILRIGHGEITLDPHSAHSCARLASFDLANTSFFLSPCNILQLYGCSDAIACKGNCLIPDLGGPGSQNCTGPRRQPPCCQDLGPLNRLAYGSSSRKQPDERGGYAIKPFTAGYRSLANFSTHFNCSSFSSWSYKRAKDNQSVSAEYGLRLPWYVKGGCAVCSENGSVCILSSEDSSLARCECKAGYTGDGYARGSGCRLVAGSHASATWWSLWKTAAMASGIVAIATIVGASVAVATVVRRSRRPWSGHQKLEGLKLIHGVDARLAELASRSEIFTYRQLERATKGFAASEKLGNGACGTVYAGALEDGRRVAVKRLHLYQSREGFQQIINELNILSRVKHRNLVRLLGCCVECADPLLVFEYVPNGTLAEHLQGERARLDWFTRLTVAAETADAIAYLHSMDPPILHRDIKSRNILLDNQFNTKVADFGLSRPGLSGVQLLDASHISTIPQGTPGYVDPDYHQNFHLSDKSDVYSFGVVLIEIITGLKPIDFARDKKEVNLAAMAVAKISAGCLHHIVDPALQADRCPAVKAMVQRLAELAFRCLAFDKDARPSMAEVLEELLLIRGAIKPPLADVSSDSWAEAATTASSSSCDGAGGGNSGSSEGDRFFLVSADPRR